MKQPNLYRIMLPWEALMVWEQIQKHLPDAYRKVPVEQGLLLKPDTLAFVIGTFSGAFLLTDFRIGWRSALHVVIWDKEYKGRAEEARTVVYELMHMYSLRRVESYIPTFNKLAIRYAEAIGMSLEGVLRKAGIYDGDFVDLVVYSLLQEEKHG